LSQSFNSNMADATGFLQVWSSLPRGDLSRTTPQPELGARCQKCLRRIFKTNKERFIWVYILNFLIYFESVLVFHFTVSLTLYYLFHASLQGETESDKGQDKVRLFQFLTSKSDQHSLIWHPQQSVKLTVLLQVDIISHCWSWRLSSLSLRENDRKQKGHW
jgi:hypothetical protein